jgi:hypothetical protein
MFSSTASFDVSLSRCKLLSPSSCAEERESKFPQFAALATYRTWLQIFVFVFRSLPQIFPKTDSTGDSVLYAKALVFVRVNHFYVLHFVKSGTIDHIYCRATVNCCFKFGTAYCNIDPVIVLCICHGTVIVFIGTRV